AHFGKAGTLRGYRQDVLLIGPERFPLRADTVFYQTDYVRAAARQPHGYFSRLNTDQSKSSTSYQYTEYS
ncbi:MAG: hypothetical protein K2K65_05695, partial [Duncaniella sp.]|nr:hypothetical protein [Duncaniella sp.]